jgi:DNA-binding NarL/FixJ family response regulator
MTAVAIEPGRPSDRLRGTTVLVLDREEIALWGFAALLGAQPWVARCILAAHPADARAKARDDPPDVVLLDASWGAECLRELVADLRGIAPDVRTITVGGSTTRGELPVAGPAVMKTWSVTRLVHDLRTAVEGPGEGGVPEVAPTVGLTDRERQVLALVARGATNREIGSRLYLSPHTIKQHTCSAYRKLHARNRAEAVARARALGLISC